MKAREILRLYFRRAREDRTPAEYAADLGCSEEHVVAVEDGKAPVTAEHLDRIAHASGKTLGMVLAELALLARERSE